MRADASESTFLRHVACPDCGSSDANAVYDDGHEYCFACGRHGGNKGDTGVPSEQRLDERPKEGMIVGGEFKALRSRRIDEATCKHFGYRVAEFKGKTVQVAPYYDKDGRLVAQHVRFANKKFIWLGDPKAAMPFGAHRWQPTGKMLVVTEGEVDALSVSKAQGNAYPVVSIGCGAGPQVKKYFAKHMQYFAGYERVILMFDMDDPGRQAARDAAQVLGPRARIAELPRKDASEMLVAGDVKTIIDAIWRAKEYRPEGIVDMADLRERVKERPQWGLSWPFESLTKLTFGIRLGEIYALGAGTGIGKTDLYTQTIKHLIVEHKVPVGVFALEQSPTETATRIAGKLAGKTFHIPDAGWTDEDLETAWKTLMSSGKVFLYDSFGVNEWDTIEEKIRYLRHAHDVEYFFLDHLTALSAEAEDERKEIERLMAKMGSLVKELNCTILFISHLATPDQGKSHEEGGRVTIRQFKGSRAIGFWSHFMFGLERDQQANTLTTRQTTTFRVLKDRYTGRATGEVFYLGYDHETGLLHEVPEPGAAERFGFADESGDDKEDREEF